MKPLSLQQRLHRHIKIIASDIITVCTMLKSFLLCSIAHAQHSVGKMSVVTKCAVTSQKHLIVPGLQKLLEEIVPIQTFMEQFKKETQ